jgi:hypothetical protein
MGSEVQKKPIPLSMRPTIPEFAERVYFKYALSNTAQEPLTKYCIKSLLDP